MSVRAYTWSVITYDPITDYQALIAKCNKWVYAYHDKDWVVDEFGNKKPKGPHYHNLLSFEQQVSYEYIKGLCNTEHTIMGQIVKNKMPNGEQSVRGAWDYLTHRGENPEEKFLYDDDIRISNDIEYWIKRCDKEVIDLATNDSFLDDLLNIEVEFDLQYMGRKYGRDFIKNMNSYVHYRETVLGINKRKREKELWEEIEKFCVDNAITWQEAKVALQYASVELALVEANPNNYFDPYMSNDRLSRYKKYKGRGINNE